MSELTFKSPGVGTKEIDLSGPVGISPTGIPAGVIGTANRGPAFVPVTVATFRDWQAKFGSTSGKFGPLAMREWLRNAGAGTYVRVLGAGDGNARTTSGNNQGKVTNAGFVVGQELVQGNGNVLANTKAFAVQTSPHEGLGRTYFLGAFMKDASSSTYLSDAGIVTSTSAHPMIRAVVLAPSGVLLSLSSSYVSGSTQFVPNNTVSATYGISGSLASGSRGGVAVRDAHLFQPPMAGANFGDVVLGSGGSDFTMFLNGHKASDVAGHTLTASFDPKAPHYFSKTFNTDPTRIEEMGHYLYTYWDVDSRYAVVTGSGLAGVVSNTTETAAFLLTGSQARNAGSSTHPNYENFEDRFSSAFSPFVISQEYGGAPKNLFRLRSLDDGVPKTPTKITIENVQASRNRNNDFGSFDVLVRSLGDSDAVPRVLESYRNVNIDPTSDRYIARVIGDMNTYYDFDKKAGGQKLVIDGVYPNRSSYIRVELSDDLKNRTINDDAIPLGFRGLHHLVTSGSTTGDSLLTGSLGGGMSTSGEAIGISTDEVKRTVQLPLPFRDNISKGTSPKKTVDSALTWGIQFELKDSLTEPNKNQKTDPGIYGFTKYFPSFHTSNQNPWVGDNEGLTDVDGKILDADRFNNNKFTLENVEVITNSSDQPDAQQWSVATYRRDGGAATSMTDKDGNAGQTSRFLDAAKDFDHLPTKKYLKFTFPLQGGFDGVNIFDKDKSAFLDAAVRREMSDSTKQGAATGPTVSAYRKAVDVMEQKSDVDIKLLAIPGMRHTAVSDYAIESVERRFDALFIMDVEEKDSLSSFVTSSQSKISVTNTTTTLTSRALDSSFAAAYFPDVVMTDPGTGANVQCPPSVAVLGAFSLNDAVAHPWYAPAGFTRGALNVVESHVKLNRTNLDELYAADINPITSRPGGRGPIVFGQKTLLAAQSALDRVNVRRLLIDIRRKVKAVANTLLFEPNRESTLGTFSAAVVPLLNTIQQQQGLDRFKVTIDTTTTTQTDVENNTIRGKIFLQPTRTVEFISLDFVVTNAGGEI